jgi:hypothetical protein
MSSNLSTAFCARRDSKQNIFNPYIDKINAAIHNGKTEVTLENWERTENEILFEATLIQAGYKVSYVNSDRIKEINKKMKDTWKEVEKATSIWCLTLPPTPLYEHPPKLIVSW